MKKNVLVLLILCFISSAQPAFTASGLGTLSNLDDVTWSDILRGDKHSHSDLSLLVTILEKVGIKPLVYTGVGLVTLAVVSDIQKRNPDFFNGLLRWTGYPFNLIQKRCQRFFSGGTSLSWNDLASWHNRIAKLFLPLTKTTSVLDLSKERRLRSIDLDSSEGEQKDEQWLATVAHIKSECSFLCSLFEKHRRHYSSVYEANLIPKDEGYFVRSVKAPVRGVKDFGKWISQNISLTRDEEIDFGLTEAVKYLEELSQYCQSVKQSSALDKEIVKRLMTSTCAIIEHLGVLVDEVGAADKAKKKLSMTLDTSTTKGFTTGGFDGGFAGS